MIDVNKIMEIITEQFVSVMDQDPDFYSDYNIILSNEQQYVKNRERDVNAIYIVVKFMPATLNFGQSVLPITINAMGERNKIDVCQHLLLEFAQTYNLGDPITSGDDIIKQVYTSPTVLNNFNDVDIGFRSLFYMSGTFLIGSSINSIESISYNIGGGRHQEIDFLASSWAFDIQLDSQAFFGTNSRTKSKSRIGTLTLNITSYLLENVFFSKILGIAWNNTTLAPDGIKSVFKLTVKFKSGLTVTDMDFMLVNVAEQQNIGEFPVVTLTFTN